MRRLGIGFLVLTLTLLTMMLGVSAALAASPHFKKGGEPVCTITGSGASRTVVCSGSLAGLGNEDLLLESTVTGFAVYLCQNKGGNPAPGQNKVLEGPQTEPTLIPSGEIKNGTLAFTTNPNTLEVDDRVSGAEAGCPNPNWAGVNPTLTITDIALSIQQPVGTEIFHCTASDPDGLSGTVALSCESPSPPADRERELRCRPAPSILALLYRTDDEIHVGPGGVAQTPIGPLH